MIEKERVQALINLKNIKDNVAALREKLVGNSKVMFIIKADGYGHGACQIMNYLGNDVDAFGVATAAEAVQLREAGCLKMILILGYTPVKDIPVVVKYNISQAVFDYETAKLLSDEAVKQDRYVKIHIKLDTGMGRIGFKPGDEALEDIVKISKLPSLEFEGVFSHFSKADEKDLTYTEKQLSVFLDFVDRLKAAGVPFKMRHISNSAGVIQFSKANLDMVRFGISNYGLYPSEDIDRSSVELKPAMEIKSIVSHIKEVEKGTLISYGGTYKAPDRRIIATVPVGYADGYPRACSNQADVLIHGRRAPITGRVCMDQMMVDITDISDVKKEDIVTLIGRDGDEFISVEELSEMAGSFNYEFVCDIGKRVPRTYID